jgi:HK97 family phage portal protein
MSIWRSLIGLVTGAGYRQQGIQYGVPSYSQDAALPVTLDSALQLSAVWACVRLISESVASLPLNVYDKDSKTGVKTVNTEHPLSKLFNGNRNPNKWQTRQEFFETLTYQLVLTGNNYTAIERDSRGEIISLIPLMSEQMEVTLDDNNNIMYRYTDGNNVRIYSDKTIWQNKLFGNGIIGLSPLGYARNSIGIGQAAEKSVAKIYKNGGKPSGVLTIDKVLTAEQRKAVKENFSGVVEGNDNRLFTLEAGMQYQQVSLSPQDIELLASRRFQIEDIARFFGVPSVLINDTSAGTTWGSGIQQIVQGFYKLGLRPYLERYEASIKARLLKPEERHRMEIEFDFNSLLRPDQSERIKAGKEAVQGGLLTPNEFRNSEGWMSQEGGDDLLVQRQMVPLKKAGEITGITGGGNAEN